MPSIHESQGVDRTSLRPTASTPTLGNLPPDENMGTSVRSPFMLSSMPEVAASGDLLGRQFYNGSRVPQQRILPTTRRTG